MNNRYELKARAYMRPVMQWAISKGIPFFTWSDQRKALAQYELFRSILN